ncbi:peptidogalycan biosysnthesis protein [Chengkuizengella axinellae]|uniref:Peptidogalycan biosysnthesis protein n=1 Tax=Chengkuizengella axinellae TaxID=3064388 RepID=A0ABT9J662_9BACL|nr:peptidogalycan biosysnthesis protein [Chengkuizengella sp. 2205SS18-9]MDP5277120.1 peptidogalycan biosysnthesis protein [Chengkuizengella sp. 2205SS18-9]
MSLEIIVYNSLKEINWGDLSVNRSVFQAWEWYQSSNSIGELEIIVIKKNTIPIAVLPIYILKDKGYYYHNPKDIFCGERERKLFNNQLFRRFEKILDKEWFPCAVTVSPYGYRGGLIHSTKLNDDVYEKIIEVIDNVCIKHKVKLISHYYLNEDDDDKWIKKLYIHDYNVINTGADCNIDITWRSMDEYYSYLGSRGRKMRSFSKNMKKKADVRWEIIDQFDFSPNNKRKMDSIIQLFIKTSLKYNDVSPSFHFFQNLFKNESLEKLIMIGVNTSGIIQSSLFCFVKESIFYPKFFGSLTSDDYFYLGGPWLIETAIRKKFKRIEMGGGSHQAKLQRGGKLRLLYSAVKVYDFDDEFLLNTYLKQYHMTKLNYFCNMAEKYHKDHSSVNALEIIK